MPSADCPCPVRRRGRQQAAGQGAFCAQSTSWQHQLWVAVAHVSRPSNQLVCPSKGDAHLGAAMLQEASINALRATCKTVGNKDVDPFIPVLIDSIAKPSEVAECVHKLSATTFVQVNMTATTMVLQPVNACGWRTHFSA